MTLDPTTFGKYKAAIMLAADLNSLDDSFKPLKRKISKLINANNTGLNDISRMPGRITRQKVFTMWLDHNLKQAKEKCFNDYAKTNLEISVLFAVIKTDTKKYIEYSEIYARLNGTD